MSLIALKMNPRKRSHNRIRDNNILFRIFESKWSIPLFLLIITILAYGLLIPFLGLYWDGWPYLWQFHVFGTQGFPEFVSSDRPYSAFIFMLMGWLFGEKVILYHIFTLICRWCSALAFYWLLNQIWKKNIGINVTAALLFLVYPGFLQQPIALPYGHHISHLALFIFSLVLMLKSLENHKHYVALTGLSLITSTIMFSLEYFATLELIRPFLIYLYRKHNTRKSSPDFSTIFRLWSPYLILLIYFFVWRIFIFKFPTYQPKLLEEFSLSGQSALGNTFRKIISDLWTVLVLSWKNIFSIPSPQEYGYPAFYGFIFLIIISFISIAVFFFIIEKIKDNKNDTHSQEITEYIYIGIISLLFAGGIVWITKLPLVIEFAWDRLTLPFIFGVSLVITSISWKIFRNKSLRIFLFAALISGAIGFHFINSVTYMHNWENFQNFFWQLIWRAPQLKENTILLSSNFPLKYYSDNSLTAPLNWIYNPDAKKKELNYLFYYADVRLKTGSLPALEKNINIYRGYRSFYFYGNTNNVLVVRYDPPGCVQILDPIYANAGIIPNLSQLEADEIPISNLDQIIPNPTIHARPPENIFSIGGEKSWCYYFEKADLARQFNDWQEVAQLEKEARDQNLHPRIMSEWLPFLDAHLHLGNEKEVEEIVSKIISAEEGKYTQGVCFTLERIMDEVNQNTNYSFILNLYNAINC